MAIKVTRKDQSEANENIIRRFNRKVLQSGMMPLKKSQMRFSKPISKRDRRKRAIIREIRRAEKGRENQVGFEIKNSPLCGEFLWYNELMIIAFLGGPGSGKSTVAQRLAGDLKWPWISSGAILRESDEPWVRERLKAGLLFDDEMVSGLVFSRLAGVPNAVFDGYPRSLRQAQIINEHETKIDLLVELEVPIEEVKARLKLRGRDEDEERVIDERTAEFEEKKGDILAYLIGTGSKYIKISGVGAQDEVYLRAATQIRDVLTGKIQSSEV